MPILKLLGSWLPGPEQRGSQEMLEFEQDPWPQGIQHPGPTERWGLKELIYIHFMSH